MIGKLILLPILAGVGVKVLILLPIILSKIALLGILSFVSSNLSLLVSAVLGVRSYFFDDKSSDEDHDYDYRYKNRYESHKSSKYGNHKDLHDDHAHYEDDYDAYDKFMHRYKGYKSLRSGYNPHYAEFRDHDVHESPKKRFRPFKLLGRIKDVIKDHFHKSEGHEQRYRGYDHDQKHHPYELHDNHEDYNHKLHETKHKYPEYSVANYNHDQKGEHYERYMVPEDWSKKKEYMSSLISKDEINQQHSTATSDDHLEISLEDVAGKLTSKNSPLTSIPTGYEIDKNYGKLKKPLIILGIRPEKEDSDSPVAFYATDYKISDFHTVPQADTSK